MKFGIFDILNLAIFITGIIAIVRWKHITKHFYPFIFLMWIGCITEVISYVLTYHGKRTLINVNIYGILEAGFILWFFKELNIFKKRTSFFVFLAGILCCIWLLEILAIGGLDAYIIYFRIAYSFVIVLLSISAINRLLLLQQNDILKDARFIICIGFITYFTCYVIVNAFWLVGLKNNDFLLNIYYIMLVVNFISYLIFIYALLNISKPNVQRHE